MPGSRAGPYNRPPHACRGAESLKAKDLLFACFVLFAALFVWPLLTLANRPLLVLGIPVLALYLFALWAAIVVVLAWVAVRAIDEEEP